MVRELSIISPLNLCLFRSEFSPPSLPDVSSPPQRPSDVPDFISRWPMQCHLQEHFRSYPDGALPEPGRVTSGDHRSSNTWASSVTNVAVTEVSLQFQILAKPLRNLKYRKTSEIRGPLASQPPHSTFPPSSMSGNAQGEEDTIIIGEVSCFVVPLIPSNDMHFEDTKRSRSGPSEPSNTLAKFAFEMV